MPYNQTILPIPPLFLQTQSYDARADRKSLRSLIGQGVEGVGELLVSTNNNMVLDIAPGAAYVVGQNIADQGIYRVFIAAELSVTVPAAHATLPRLDQVILRVLDNAADASGYNEARIEVVPGTATAGATLANRNGAHTLVGLDHASSSLIRLCDVLVAATDTTLNAGDIRDRRPRSLIGHGASRMFDGVFVRGSQTLALANWSSITNLGNVAEEFDLQEYWTSTTPGVITIPRTGWYSMDLATAHNVIAGNYSAAHRFVVNGVAYTPGQATGMIMAAGLNGQTLQSRVSRIFAAGDTVGLEIYSSDGTSHGVSWELAIESRGSNV